MAGNPNRKNLFSAQNEIGNGKLRNLMLCRHVLDPIHVSKVWLKLFSNKLCDRCMIKVWILNEKYLNSLHFFIAWRKDSKLSVKVFKMKYWQSETNSEIKITDLSVSIAIMHLSRGLVKTDHGIHWSILLTTAVVSSILFYTISVPKSLSI